MRRYSAGLSAAAFATLLSCGTALAADADAFAERLKSVMSSQGGGFAYDAASSEGENVTLTNVVLGTGEETADVGDLTFENVTGSTEEGWTVERLPIADVEGSDTPEGADQPMNYAFSDMSIENIRIVGTNPGDDVPAVLQAFSILYDRATIGSVELSDGDTPVFSMTDFTSTNEIAEDGSWSGDLSAPQFTVEVPEQMEDGSPNPARELGYEEIAGSMQGDMAWTPESGTVSLDPLSFDVADAGKLDLTFGIDGYTEELSRSLQQMSEQMQANPDNQQNSGMAMMGILAQLQIADIAIAFEDDSLTQRVLDYYAEQMGQSPETVIDIAVQIVQGNIGQIGDAAFQSQVTDAVRSYLEDPQSIRVASEPAQPIPVMQVFGAAMGAPQTIPNVLQLQVEANGASAANAGSAPDGGANGSMDAPAASDDGSSSDMQDAQGSESTQ